MTVSQTQGFNPAPILLGSTRNKSAGWSKGHPTTKKAMYAYAQKTVKGIVKEWPHRLLGSSRGADRGDLTDLLGKNRIDRRDGGSVVPQSSISDHVCGRYPQYVGQFGCSIPCQYKVREYLLGYSALDCLDLGVQA